MENKVNHKQAINFINFFIHSETKETQNKAESRKMGLQFFKMYFDQRISFMLSLNAHHTYFKSLVHHTFVNRYINVYKKIY